MPSQSRDPRVRSTRSSGGDRVKNRVSGAARATGSFALLTALLAAFFTALLAGEVAAWGADGHRIVGEIAWQHLDPAVKPRVRALLSGGRYRTLYEACVWADRYARGKPEYVWTLPLHYIAVDPAAERVVLDETNCPQGACVVEAIRTFNRVLSDPDASRDAKIEALRLAGHFVGDVHQPLHVRHPDGCGGCRTDVRLRNEKVDLHKLWDSALLEDILFRRYGGEDGKAPSGSWRKYARELMERADSAGTEKVDDLDPLVWAQESLDLARTDLFTPSDEIVLPPEYLIRAQPVLERRLREAGLRLAGLLNAALSGDPGRIPYGKDAHGSR